ncbi:MAG: twin-arginine translocation signal domain-containing protein [Proteobacteria bacterium]|nr:twin-arginine translocation signal domain-containing protein [Pseudomonadota bacterium]
MTAKIVTSPATRREFLTNACALVAAAGVPSLVHGAEVAAVPAWPKPTLHAYASYGWLRGFSVVPSWGARIEDAWWLYDAARMREEVALAKQVHANCIRLWIEFSAWMADPDKVTASFLDAVAAIGENGMKVMPCLFNRWHDSKFDYGGTYVENLKPGWKQPLDYVKALVTPFAQDDRVLIWDLCNEPQAHDLNNDANKREFAWLSEIAATVRACGARQPITIGTMNGGNIETYAPLMDVLCAHPYARTKPDLEKFIAGYKALQTKHQKPLLVNETIPGALDDIVRAEVARYYTESLAEAGFGWQGWALREGKAISTRRDRYDGNGINGQGFHPYFTKEGKLRGGLEFMTEKPKHRAPWAKA